MMTDLYQLTMMHGYLHHGMQNNRACFDLFYRKRGDIMAYAVAAGLEQAIEYVQRAIIAICDRMRRMRLN